MASTEGQEDHHIERRDAEIALLQAMFPTGISWHEHRQELIYKSDNGGILTIRVPDNYPADVRPELISAVDGNKDDIRNKVRKHIDELSLQLGEEIIDALIQAFDETLVEQEQQIEESNDSAKIDHGSTATVSYKTVVIWLHHLLNTNKRKLALNPTVDPSDVTGVTKPGYPGILLYTGTTTAVDKHVSELKAQRWQAFQVRFEEINDTTWTFSHGSGVKELESMSEVTQSITSGKNREMFLKATGIR